MHRLTRVLVIVSLVAVLLALMGCTSGSGSSGGNAAGGTSAGTNAVSISNFAFEPANIDVTAGSTVTWTNKDSTQHTVTADDGSFNGIMESGKTFSFTFAKPGTYKYHCSIHPSMMGQVVVK